MTFYDAPNQQVVREDGSGPWDEGDGGVPGTLDESQFVAVEESSPESYDPGEFTVDEVKDYVEAHPDERQSILDAESSGKNRTTLVDYLGGETS